MRPTVSPMNKEPTTFEDGEPSPHLTGEELRAGRPRPLKKLKRRKIPREVRWPRITEENVLAWADAYRLRTGKWPNTGSGRVDEMPALTWQRLDQMMRNGLRGLSGRSLSILLECERGVPHRLHVPRLSIEQILSWADAFKSRQGRWPKSDSGEVEGMPGLTWNQVDSCLIQGCRGLPGGSSLAQLLFAARGVRHHLNLPKISESQILEWADSHYLAHGEWPHVNSGPVTEAPDVTWDSINNMLTSGLRGLPGGSTLAKLLANERGKRNPAALSDLSEEKILTWADAHHSRNGRWPDEDSGPIPDVPGETWATVANAMRGGRRGLVANFSLARLLERDRGVPFGVSKQHPLLTIDQVLSWADEYFAKLGKWPTVRSGVIEGAEGLTWNALSEDLRSGQRGLPKGQTLAQLLVKERGARKRAYLPPLNDLTILKWAIAHYEREGKWPTQKSGPIHEAPEETWGGINTSLYTGTRGLQKRRSLSILLDTLRKNLEH